MELFLSVSEIGILVLLATHMMDYALESTRRSQVSQRGAARGQGAAISDVRATGGRGAVRLSGVNRVQTLRSAVSSNRM